MGAVSSNSDAAVPGAGESDISYGHDAYAPRDDADDLLDLACAEAVTRPQIIDLAERTGVDDDFIRSSAASVAAESKRDVEHQLASVDSLESELREAEWRLASDGAQPWPLRVLTAAAILTFLAVTLVLLVGVGGLAVTAVGGHMRWIFEWFGWIQGVVAGATVLVLLAVMGAFTSRHGEAVTSTDSYQRKASLEAQIESKREAILRDTLDDRLIPELTRRLNQLTAPVYSRDLVMGSSKGLSEPLSQRLEVPTEVQQQVLRRIGGWSGGTIGISGPRGIGKSTLLESICRGGDSDAAKRIAVLVSAPVQYHPREFILYLFGQLCKAVLRDHGAAVDPSDNPLSVRAQSVRALQKRPFGRLAWRLGRTLSPTHSSLSVPADPPGVVSSARDWLHQIHYQQSFTSGWGGGMNLGVTGKFEQGQSATRTTMTQPEVVSYFRRFVEQVALDRRVVIAIDEMDKLQADDDAHRFLNDVKAIFGIRNAFFLLSVSEDALAAFDRRGLPVRDALDSSFDDVVSMTYMDYEGSVAMLSRRVVGLPVPFAALCHVLGGGLPRELLRWARALAELYDSAGSSDVGQVAATLVMRDFAAKVSATERVAHRGGASGPHALVLEVTKVLRRRGLSGFPEAMDELGNALQSPMPHSRERELALELLGYAYFAWSVVEFFGDESRGDIIMTAVDGAVPGGSIDALAQARQAFAVDPQDAWDRVSVFRESWEREPCARPDSLAAA